MITLKEITQDIENGLNGITAGQPEEYNSIYFKLFPDTGRFRRAKKKINDVSDPINGVVSLVSSQTTPNADGSVIAMLTCRVELVARLKDEEENVMQEESTSEQLVEEGNAVYVQHIRNIISSYTQSQGFKTMDESGQSYTVSVSFNFAETGTRAQRDRTGDSMTFVFYAYYNVIQNGQNSRNYVFRLDGQIIPYQQCTVSRTSISDADVYSNGVGSKTTSSGSVFSVTLAVPAFKSTLNSSIIDKFILGKESSPNIAHILEVFYGSDKEGNSITEVFLVSISEASNTMQGVLNVGGQITLSEIVDDFDLITFSKLLKITKCTASTKHYTITTSTPQTLIAYVEDECGYTTVSTNKKDENVYTTALLLFSKDTIVVGYDYTYKTGD